MLITGDCLTHIDLFSGIVQNIISERKDTAIRNTKRAVITRVDARVSNRVDRLKSLGNAIVPQIAYEIMKAITAARLPLLDAL
jgi:acetyl-CoA carboxylase alpha subunit